MFDLKIALSIFGIYFAYIVMSLFMQKMYLHQYPSIFDNQPPEKFKFPAFHVWLGSLFCSIFGFIKSVVIKQRPNPIPIRQTTILGALYTLNILGVNIALKYLPFHVELIGGNIRLLVVIIVGLFFTRVRGEFKHRLRRSKLMIGSIVTFGTIIFSLFNQSGHERLKSQDEIIFGISEQNFGYIVLVISVLADAFFVDNQAYQKANFGPSSTHLFISVNFATFLICLGYSFLHPQDNIVHHYNFVMSHPTIIKQLVIINILQVLGQISIYHVIANCSQHIFPLVSTIRRIVTFILSVVFYGHIVKQIQVIAVMIIFSGIAIQYYDQFKHKVKQLKTKQMVKIEQRNI